MFNKLMILVVCIPLMVGQGCAVTGWILPGRNGGGDVTLGGLSQHHPEPGTPGYRASVIMGLIGDTLWIPILGLGFVWWVIDILYLWVVGGGYSARWYAYYGHGDGAAPPDEYDGHPDDRRDHRRR